MKSTLTKLERFADMTLGTGGVTKMALCYSLLDWCEERQSELKRIEDKLRRRYDCEIELINIDDGSIQGLEFDVIFFDELGFIKEDQSVKTKKRKVRKEKPFWQMKNRWS